MIRPVPGLMIEEQPEPWVVRACLWAEARGEPAIGKLGVLWVLHHRAIKRDTSLKAEVLRPRQFSSFNADDPNRAKLLTAYLNDVSMWAACDAVAELFESKATVDPTLGATHYYAHDVVTPAWGPGHPQWEHCIVLGRHTFGRAA